MLMVALGAAMIALGMSKVGEVIYPYQVSGIPIKFEAEFLWHIVSEAEIWVPFTFGFLMLGYAIILEHLKTKDPK